MPGAKLITWFGRRAGLGWKQIRRGRWGQDSRKAECTGPCVMKGRAPSSTVVSKGNWWDHVFTCKESLWVGLESAGRGGRKARQQTAEKSGARGKMGLVRMEKRKPR